LVEFFGANKSILARASDCSYSLHGNTSKTQEGNLVLTRFFCYWADALVVPPRLCVALLLLPEEVFEVPECVLCVMPVAGLCAVAALAECALPELVCAVSAGSDFECAATSAVSREAEALW
jgi:hypothetical protein